LAGLGLALLAAPLAAEARPSGKAPRIGILRIGSPPDPSVEVAIDPVGAGLVASLARPDGNVLARANDAVQ
jgi:hypothetical protein